ncbi:uncharacterized protein LOC142231160 [Haematobia irritans]|uniref:uncharacterized protein LOC142231160 n=1 Tax=Haematobia irritans TaxID=7368 RepID=UPI003F506E44
MMQEEECLLILCIGAATTSLMESDNKKRLKRQWVREWVKRRKEEGCCAKLLKELRSETPSLYKNFLRMNASDFDYLLRLVAPYITKKSTHLREPIPPSDRLAVTLRYLPTGENFRSLQYIFRIPHNTISTIIPEVCEAIFKALQPEYLKISIYYYTNVPTNLNLFLKTLLNSPDWRTITQCLVSSQQQLL